MKFKVGDFVLYKEDDIIENCIVVEVYNDKTICMQTLEVLDNLPEDTTPRYFDRSFEADQYECHIELITDENTLNRLEKIVVFK